MTQSMQGQPGLIRIQTLESDPVSIEALMDAAMPNMTSGYATWEEIARRKRKSLTEWSGSGPFKMNLPLLLDGFAHGESVEDIIKDIEGLGGRRTRGAEDHPPVFTIYFPGQVPRGNAWKWVCENIEWGNYERREFDGKRIRQYVTLSIMEWVNPNVIEISKAKKRKKSKKPKRPKVGKIYVTKEGDTLKKIASKHLDYPNRWKDIRKLNPKYRDPNKVLKKGTRLKLPVTYGIYDPRHYEGPPGDTSLREIGLE